MRQQANWNLMRKFPFLTLNVTEIPTKPLCVHLLNTRKTFHQNVSSSQLSARKVWSAKLFQHPQYNHRLIEANKIHKERRSHASAKQLDIRLLQEAATTDIAASTCVPRPRL